jgi:hypothetical protein
MRAPGSNICREAIFLLQQGNRVADVCFLVDEDLGYTLPNWIVASLRGHDFEVAYPADVRAMSFENGALRHPHGAAFRLLVTPEARLSRSWVAEIATLRKLAELVRSGASLSGPAPTAPAGLKDLERSREFARLTRELWGDLPERGFKRVGAGRVYAGLTPAEILRSEEIAPDLSWGGPMTELRYLHRRTDDSDIYFAHNYSDRPRLANLAVRVADLPEGGEPVHPGAPDEASGLAVSPQRPPRMAAAQLCHLDTL